MQTDKDKQVCGLLTKQYIDECFGGRYGYNLYSRKLVREMLDNNYLEVDSRMPIETVAKLALIRPKSMLYDAIIVSDNGKYDGLVTVKDLLEACHDNEFMGHIGCDDFRGTSDE